jgi:CheY-like chemotaxis protein
MDALGQLTGGIAHDFNNMLMVVGGYKAIELATNRAENLTRQLLRFSRRQSLSPATVDLAQRLAEFRAILTSSVGGNVRLEITIGQEVWPVTVDPNEFEVALVNLAVNARDAMPNGGSVRITARNATLNPGAQADGLVGEFVIVEVRDEGVGIPADILPKVFDPFFTTKGIDRGTGLGLSQVYGFAHQSGGTVRISSARGAGTTVFLYLPRGADRTADRDAYQRDVEAPGGAETILVVEDNSEVRCVTVEMLGQLGYRVVEADCADQALAILSSGKNIDLVLTDIVMPGKLDGFDLAEQIKTHYWRVPVLLTTGYSNLPSRTQHEFMILRKPFQLLELAKSVRCTLDAGFGRRSERASERAGSSPA